MLRKKNWIYKAGRLNFVGSVGYHHKTYPRIPRILSETNSNHAKVVNELKELQEKYENTLSESLKFSEELNNAKNELEKVLIDKEKEYDTFTSQLEEIKEYAMQIKFETVYKRFCFCREFSEENDNLRESLEELTAKYEELKNSYQKNEMSSKHLSDSHKDLTLRLMKAVRLLIDEKIARKSERCRLDVVSNELIKLREEKVRIACLLSIKCNPSILFY